MYPDSTPGGNCWLHLAVRGHGRIRGSWEIYISPGGTCTHSPGITHYINSLYSHHYQFRSSEPPPHTDPTGHTVPYTLSPATVSNSPSWSSAPPASPVKPSSSLLAWSANPLFLAGTLRELRSGAHCFRVADCNSREEARVYHLASRHRHGRGFRFVYPDE